MAANGYWDDNSFKMHQPFFSAEMERYTQQMVYAPAQMLFYSFYVPGDAAGDACFTCVPHGCVDLLVIYNDRDCMLELVGSPLAKKTVRAHGAYHYFGVRCKPGMFLSFSDMSVADTVDREALFVLSDRRSDTVAALRGAPTLEDKIQVFLKTLAPLLTVAAVPEPVQRFLSRVNGSKGNVSIRALADDMGYSERQLRRVVCASMGISPKTLCRIVRFQHAVHNILTAPAAVNWQYIGDLNYTDQAHFQREFKEFTGLSPRRFAALYA